MKYKKWDEWYSIAKLLYKDTGTINVPSKFIYMDSRIGDWISVQRGQYRKGLLSVERIKLLDDLGINWEGRDILLQARNEEFIKNIELLKRYIKENGNSRVPRHFIMDGTDLGQWTSNIRNILRGKTKITLSDDHRRILDDLGFEVDWYQESLENNWRQYYLLLKEYYENNPKGIVAEDTTYKDVNIGQWLKAQRAALKRGKLTDNRIEALKKLGINLSPQDTLWDEKYAVAKKFYEEFHHLDIPNSMIIDGVKIGSWISNQRQAYNGSRDDIMLSDVRVHSFERPIFNFIIEPGYEDGGSGKYVGLGYSFDIKGNFMPEDKFPGVTKYTYYLFGIEIETQIRD